MLLSALPLCSCPGLRVRTVDCLGPKIIQSHRPSLPVEYRRLCSQSRRQPLHIAAATKGMSELQQTAANDQLIDLLKGADNQQEVVFLFCGQSNQIICHCSSLLL